jgi:hypothetical protein
LCVDGQVAENKDVRCFRDSPVPQQRQHKIAAVDALNGKTSMEIPSP